MSPRLLSVALIVSVGAALALPAASGAQTAAQDSVTGSAGFFVFGFPSPIILSVTFDDVHSGPSGENPGGTVTLNVRLAGTLVGEVTCLNVNGNQAAMVFRFPSRDNPVGGVAEVQDNDGAGQDTATIGFVFVQDPLPTTCPIVGVGGPIPGGDITVVDAPPLPTSKDQCKNGGWETYGVFKNQGDCVSYVATKGKNPPANSP
jgi:hypothetical protein